MTDTTGYIYFAIKTENDDLSLSEFDSFLTLKPTDFKYKFQNGKTPVCTIWELSSGQLTNPSYFDEIEKIVDKLEKYKNEFIELKNQNPELEYVLQVVIYLGDAHPALHFSERTLKLMDQIGCAIDCDIYNEK